MTRRARLRRKIRKSGWRMRRRDRKRATRRFEAWLYAAFQEGQP